MDRKATIGYVLIFLIIAVTFYINQQNSAEIDRIAKQEDSIKSTTRKDTPQTVPLQEIKEDTSTTSFVADTTPEKKYTIENKKLKITISSKGGKMSSVQLKDYKTFEKKPLYLLNHPSDTFNYKIYFKNGVVNTADLRFEPTTVAGNSITMVAKTNGGTIKVLYSLKPDAYNLNYSLHLENCQEQIPQSQNYIDLKWVNNIGLVERNIEAEKPTTTVFYKYKTDDGVENLSETDADEL